MNEIIVTEAFKLAIFIIEAIIVLTVAGTISYGIFKYLYTKRLKEYYKTDKD